MTSIRVVQEDASEMRDKITIHIDYNLTVGNILNNTKLD